MQCRGKKKMLQFIEQQTAAKKAARVAAAATASINNQICGWKKVVHAHSI
jgi:hypothetical protein